MKKKNKPESQFAWNSTHSQEGFVVEGRENKVGQMDLL